MANGTIRKKNSGWEYRVYINGKQKSFVGATRKDALDKYARFLKTRPAKINSLDPLLFDWVETWLETIKRPSVSFTTYRNYKLYAENYILEFLPNKPLYEFLPVEIDGFFSNAKLKKLSASAKRHIYLTLRGVLSLRYKMAI